MRPPTTLSDADLAALADLGVATVHEAMGRAGGLMDADIRPGQQDRAIAGRAVTALAPEGDNWALHGALAIVEPGDVLVAAIQGVRPFGYFGDIMARAARVRGGVGLVIDGAVRDSAQMRAMGFPVWSRGVHARGTIKAHPGSVGVPVRCAGVWVAPGDIVVADDDGVVVVPRASAPEVLAAARQRVLREEAMRAALDQGQTTLQYLGLAGGTSGTVD